jgi:[2-(trimethylamino)ethyl]phosphonate dioxygenase
MNVPRVQTAEPRDACVRFRWSDGFEAELASAWLWDNAAPMAAAVGRQRLRSAQSLIAAGSIQSVSIAEDVVRIEFAVGSVAWSGAQLREEIARERDAGAEIIHWSNGNNIAARPAMAYAAYLSDEASLAHALSEVARFGLVRLAGAGTEPDELERTVARFGFIRETNYGRLFEVRVVADADNLAFTAQALEPHTDNPYREPVPTLQLLHCIRNSGAGGATTFIDGFALAEWFRNRHPDDFRRLAQHAVPFAFTNSAGDCYAARTPIIRLSANDEFQGLRFNHRALGSVDFPADETALWYGSYLEFAKEADAPARRFPFAMKPGDIVIFDNERILHGREAFSGASERFLKGCYADRDALKATLARLACG